jgi:lauroyl/myristoyl acyltransferase
MNIAAYIRERNALVERIENLDVISNNNLLSHLTLTSANFRKLMPLLSASEHLRCFKNIVLHQQLSALEHKWTDSLAFLTLEGLLPQTNQLLMESPAIICTFHSGSYRMLNTFLMQRQVPYALVASASILQKQKSSYLHTFDRLHLGYLYNDFTLIAAESPSCGLQMLRALKQGKSLLVYIDGNTGVKQDQSKSHLIDFMNGKIFARTGVPFLAHTARVPIIPAICYRKSIDEPVLRFFEPIYPNGSRQHFSAFALKQIYDNFATVIHEHPEQWEAWMYLHRSIYLETTTPDNQISDKSMLELVAMNKERFGLINTEKMKVLFDKDSYLSYPLCNHLYAALFQTLFKNN